jgi:glucose-6-phosphate 1-dehydrogenase
LAISVGVRVKKPGVEIGSMPAELLVVRDTVSDETVAYERLLTDAMEGEQTLFVREDAIEASWRAVEDILDDAAPVYPYDPGTWGPAEADRLIAGFGSWQTPSQVAADVT